MPFTPPQKPSYSSSLKRPSSFQARARSRIPPGAKWGLSLQSAIIVKYRDAKTDARVHLEDLLR